MLLYFYGLINGILVLGSVAWPFAAFSSIFLFDSSSSTSSPVTIALAISVLGYPIPAVFGNILFWKSRNTSSSMEKFKYTMVSSSGYIAIGLFVILLEFVCQGRFACN